ncbi:DUF1491 family protein [Sphingomonas sp. SCN 67-18]|uniref:DUF1491 family protein n=1 Tax=uncultured Sphingomonas sp. TaxID=158754 RepID=UPI0025D9472C|nr:DUF1491 family protein [Sphingomonas sp. SCN 67-18]
MSQRLTSRMLVSALLRRVSGAGGTGAVLRRGDEQAGAVLLMCMERGRLTSLIERVADMGGGYRWADCGPEDRADGSAVQAYLDRRQARDPDLWIVELDIPQAERFAAETIVGA